MARSIYFMAFLVLAMTLFVAYGVEAQNICKTKSKTFKGICIYDSSCREACLTEGFEDGHCSKIQRRCLCTKICVFENTPNDVGTILVDDRKTLREALLEEEILVQ